ncbi:uncharacterized protein BT62DRAFT_629245 [Guyanagaster necrorhizus]|uniref:Zn(2)-C6 fungal-type domain-containing protein n=1 Tax=Guyanagaster necrorhizus TaxID=856835 RepID=A0A9P8AM39_9AGAR|nr:uncharacterized protein BT62DRAFT_629245 [Guyanagaster necrorhizus MCA 3950]KAG7440329.1 hypothetical protein BT62DRAFT_629245 [Guyanagaster necrorhizus MCA 3950]
MLSQRPLHTTQPLQPHTYQPSAQPNSWAPRYDSYDSNLTAQQYTVDSGFSPFAHNSSNYPTQPSAYPTQSSYPPPRLTPPSHQANQTQSNTDTRLSFAGSLDPSTGIFYRTPEHPRLRTAQACEKCRTRKAKCSGEHPSCKRCLTRGLICRYAPEGRVRGPNKPKKPATSSEGASPSSSQNQSSRQRRPGSSGSPSTSHATTASSPAQSTRPITTEIRPIPVGASKYRSHNRRPSLSRSSKPRPPNLELDTMSSHQMPSDGTEVPLSSHSAPSQAFSSSQPMADLRRPMLSLSDDERPQTGFIHPRGIAGLSRNSPDSNPSSAVSLTFHRTGTTPPHVYQSTSPHSTNYHYDLTPPPTTTQAYHFGNTTPPPSHVLSQASYMNDDESMTLTYSSRTGA